MNTYNVYLYKKRPTSTNKLKKSLKVWAGKLVARKGILNKKFAKISENDFYVEAESAKEAKKFVQKMTGYGAI